MFVVVSDKQQTCRRCWRSRRFFWTARRICKTCCRKLGIFVAQDNYRKITNFGPHRFRKGRNMTDMEKLMEIGDMVCAIAADLSSWSQQTFGSDDKRGPLGPLKHLEKEAREAQAQPNDITEYADCLILIIDAARRAKITPLELLKATYAKIHVNKQRQWPEPVGDEPVEHIRS